MSETPNVRVHQFKTCLPFHQHADRYLTWTPVLQWYRLCTPAPSQVHNNMAD